MSIFQGVFGLFFIVVLVECTRFNIRLAARDLPYTDIFDGSPDPYIEVLMAEGSSNDLYVKVGQTAPLSNTNDPDWREVFPFNFVVGANQRLRFEVWDEDVDSDDYMGRVDVTFAKIVNEENNTLNLNITECPTPTCGQLLIIRKLLEDTKS